MRVAAIRARHRFALGGEVAREVGGAHRVAAAAKVAHHAAAHVAAVERGRPAVGDGAQRARQVGIAQRVPGDGAAGRSRKKSAALPGYLRKCSRSVSSVVASPSLTT